MRAASLVRDETFLAIVDIGRLEVHVAGSDRFVGRNSFMGMRQRGHEDFKADLGFAFRKKAA